MDSDGNDARAYGLIAIGSGPAGEAATELAAAFGHRCLIVEKSKPGGVVTTTGGVPTKTLREAALYYSGFRDRDVYGLTLEVAPELVLERIRARTWSVCEALQQATRGNIAQRGVEYLEGEARLGPDKTVVVTIPGGHERELRAEVILVATGSRPSPRVGVPLDHPGVVDTDSILNRGRPPKSLLIVGGGAVAVEFATIARALDIPVTLVSRGERLLPQMDGEMSSALAALFSSWGVRVMGGATIERAVARGDLLEALLTNGEEVSVDTILFAAGRVSNSAGLGFEAAGVKLDARGRVAVDDSFRTSAEGIYAAGDVLGPTLASIAMEQGRAAVCHAFGIPSEGTVDPAPVSAVYGMPEIAGAGLTEEQCQARGLDYASGRSDLAVTPRGAIAGRGGLLKLIFLRENRRVVGAHCFGDIASEIVGIGQMAIRCGATLDTIANMSMNTPTYGHAYKYAAFDGLRRLTAHGGA